MYNDHDPVLLENVGNIIIDMATGLEMCMRAGSCIWISSGNVLVTRKRERAAGGF